jgi:hypothetical protein
MEAEPLLDRWQGLTGVTLELPQGIFCPLCVL